MIWGSSGKRNKARLKEVICPTSGKCVVKTLIFRLQEPVIFCYLMFHLSSFLIIICYMILSCLPPLLLVYCPLLPENGQSHARLELSLPWQFDGVYSQWEFLGKTKPRCFLSFVLLLRTGSQSFCTCHLYSLVCSPFCSVKAFVHLSLQLWAQYTLLNNIHYAYQYSYPQATYMATLVLQSFLLYTGTRVLFLNFKSIMSLI